MAFGDEIFFILVGATIIVGAILILWVSLQGTKYEIRGKAKYRIKRVFNAGNEEYWVYGRKFLFYTAMNSFSDLKSAIKYKVKLQEVQDNYLKKKKEVKEGWVSENEIKVEVL